MFICSFIGIPKLTNCNYINFYLVLLEYLWHFYCSISILNNIYLVIGKVIEKIVEGFNMTCSKLKILFCLTVCLTVLFAPFLLEISQDGKTYAFSSRSGNKSSNLGDGSRTIGGYNIVKDEQPPIHATPEPATILLFGVGAVGLAAFRKKFRKK